MDQPNTNGNFQRLGGAGKEMVYVIPVGGQASLAIIHHFVFAALPYLDWIVVSPDAPIKDGGRVKISKEQFVRVAANISVLGMTFLTAVGCGPATPPSDTSIIARFNAHRAEFSQLRIPAKLTGHSAGT
jgi:hypothetical protein